MNDPTATGGPAAERALLDRLRAGEAGAFEALVRPHLAALHSLARRLTTDAHWADDLTQETLVQAYLGIHGFRGQAALRTWLFRIQIRLAGHPERWRSSERARSLGELDIPDHLEPDQPAIERELRDRLEEAMERLTPRQRTALHLRAVEGMDYRTIAATLGASAAAARMLVLAARRSVMQRLGRHLEP